MLAGVRVSNPNPQLHLDPDLDNHNQLCIAG